MGKSTASATINGPSPLELESLSLRRVLDAEKYVRNENNYRGQFCSAHGRYFNEVPRYSSNLCELHPFCRRTNDREPCQMDWPQSMTRARKASLRNGIWHRRASRRSDGPTDLRGQHSSRGNIKTWPKLWGEPDRRVPHRAMRCRRARSTCRQKNPK
jgi:hypothetical protein